MNSKALWGMEPSNAYNYAEIFPPAHRKKNKDEEKGSDECSCSNLNLQARVRRAAEYCFERLSSLEFC